MLKSLTIPVTITPKKSDTKSLKKINVKSLIYIDVHQLLQYSCDMCVSDFKKGYIRVYKSI